jgi:hypothetical protein
MNYPLSTPKESVQRFEKTMELEIGSLYQAKEVEENHEQVVEWIQ